MSTPRPSRPRPSPRRPPRRGPSPQQRTRTLRITAFVSVVVVAVMLLVLWAVSGPLLGISNVTVVGYTGTERATVNETADLVAGTGSMVRLPKGDMRRALTRFPGVVDATVERDWPRSITVRVAMGEPVAVLAVAGGGRYLVSPTGQVMGRARSRGGLPEIAVTAYPAGGVLSARGPRAALTFIGWLPPAIAGRVRDLRAVGGGLEGKLTNGLVLRLGSATKLAEKAQALVAVLSQADPQALDQAAYLDLANPDRPMLGSSQQRTVVPGLGTGTSTDGTITTGTPTAAADATSPPGNLASPAGTETTLHP